MKISYDSEVDAVYIRLLDGKHECRTLRLNDDISLNIGPGERLVGIEVLEASRVIGRGRTPALLVDNMTVSSTATGQPATVLSEPAAEYGTMPSRRAGGKRVRPVR